MSQKFKFLHRYGARRFNPRTDPVPAPQPIEEITDVKPVLDRLYAELPASLAMRELEPWMDAQGLNGDYAWRRQFREEAIFRRMREASGPHYLHMTERKS